MTKWCLASFFLLLLIDPLAIATAENSTEATLWTLTDREGREIDAEIIRASLEEVWIRRKDGQTFRVQIAIFSDRDQERIVEWRTLDDLQRLGLGISVRRYRTDRKTSQHTSSTSRSEEIGYEITITNNLTSGLENLRAEYRVYKRHGGFVSYEQQRALSRITGIETIKAIPARSEASFSTDTITLNLNQGRRWTGDTYENFHPDKLAGVWVRIFLGNHMIAEISTPNELMTREKW